MADLKVVQIRSAIGSKPKQRGTLRALGLGRIGKTNTLPDRAEIRGMIKAVSHLVKVEESTKKTTTKEPKPAAKPTTTKEPKPAAKPTTTKNKAAATQKKSE